MFSIILKTESVSAVENFCDSLKRFLLACSWGGHESLVFPMCALHDSKNYQHNDVPWNLVRLYIGLEEPDELIADLQTALDQI